MEEGHGGAKLLIPAESTVRIGRCHRFPAELIVPHAAQAMPQQGGSDFKRDAEILQPGGEGMAQVVEVKIGHFRLSRQTSPEDAKRGRSPSPEDSPVHVGDLPA
ncbi:MAG: hypothetical protein A4E20_13275 [Nitrospira sp. SG-bin2]|nr:MAG: hypothetical protein A4E20_13275 [Nitrospira sp. SG-bin2]